MGTKELLGFHYIFNYLSTDILGLILVIVGLHAQLQLLQESLL